MSFDIDSLLISLRHGGAIVNAPARLEDVAAFEARLHVTMHPYLKEIFTTFNGFQSQDAFGFMAFWSLESILENASEVPPDMSAKRLFAIGDFLIGSDLLRTSIEDVDTPVTLQFEGRELAQNLPEFFRSLTSGKFEIRGEPPQ